MSLVWTRMNGNSPRTKAHDITSHGFEMGKIMSARISQRGDFVHIYAKASHPSLLPQKITRCKSKMGFIFYKTDLE